MIIGNQKTINYLKNLADNKLLFHSYIFFGQERVGKKTIALALANYLEKKEFSMPTQPLSDFLFIDGNKINLDTEETILDDVRKIKNFLYQKPNISFYRTVLIDNANHLTIYAQNALLKISEEPQSNSLIILISKDPELLLPTINSRFQKIFFETVKTEEILNWLISNFKINQKKAEEIANFSSGLPGIAYSILNDGEFKEYFENAKKFLKLKSQEKINFIKKIVDDENEKSKFNINLFLDLLMFILKNKGNFKKDFELWKKLFKIKMDFNFYNLNPKLQLVALGKFIEKND
jgi:DNA polymerase-3 subunit delta'